MSKTELIVSTKSGVLAISMAFVAVLVFGTLFSVSYKSECVVEYGTKNYGQPRELREEEFPPQSLISNHTDSSLGQIDSLNRVDHNFPASPPKDDAGKRTCTEHLEFLGWAGLPLQPIASAVGIGAGAFIAIARCKNPGEVIEYIARSKNDDDISSQD